MAIYTYWGNKDPQDFTMAFEVASGEIVIGNYGDFTVNEVSALMPRYDLRLGALIWTKPPKFPYSMPL